MCAISRQSGRAAGAAGGQQQGIGAAWRRAVRRSNTKATERHSRRCKVTEKELGRLWVAAKCAAAAEQARQPWELCRHHSRGLASGDGPSLAPGVSTAAGPGGGDAAPLLPPLPARPRPRARSAVEDRSTRKSDSGIGCSRSARHAGTWEEGAGRSSVSGTRAARVASKRARLRSAGLLVPRHLHASDPPEESTAAWVPSRECRMVFEFEFKRPPTSMSASCMNLPLAASCRPATSRLQPLWRMMLNSRAMSGVEVGGVVVCKCVGGGWVRGWRRLHTESRAPLQKRAQRPPQSAFAQARGERCQTLATCPLTHFAVAVVLWQHKPRRSVVAHDKHAAEEEARASSARACSHLPHRSSTAAEAPPRTTTLDSSTTAPCSNSPTVIIRGSAPQQCPTRKSTRNAPPAREEARLVHVQRR